MAHDIDETVVNLRRSGSESGSHPKYKNILQKMIIESNIQLKKTIEINSMDAIKRLLVLGNGIALLPEMVIKDELNAGLLKIIYWKGPAFNAKLFMIWNKEKHLSEPLKAFMYMVRKMI